LGGDATASATIFNGRIMAVIRKNRIEFQTDNQGVAREQYIPQKNMGVYMNVEGKKITVVFLLQIIMFRIFIEFNDLAKFASEAKAAFIQNGRLSVERFLGAKNRFKLIVGDANSKYCVQLTVTKISLTIFSQTSARLYCTV
jgi:hypothetical protein